MRSSTRVALVGIGISSLVASLFAPVPSSAGGLRNPLRSRSAVEKVADQIDQLERHIETYGTVVAKTPDVWGEARLTKHRREFEAQLKDELIKFAETINASISRSDQAFLASALALQSAAADGGNGNGGNNAAATMINDFDDPGIIDRSAPFARLRTSDFSAGKNGIALEPVIKLDQMSRYLNHLQELRRINEGDDTSDAPGYALHLVRIPISILPGKKTREGYGAEVTVTAEPYLSEDLLPSTFRNLVINDLVQQLSFVTHALMENNRAEELLLAIHERKSANLLLAQAQAKQKQAEETLAKLEKQLRDLSLSQVKSEQEYSKDLRRIVPEDSIRKLLIQDLDSNRSKYSNYSIETIPPELDKSLLDLIEKSLVAPMNQEQPKELPRNKTPELRSPEAVQDPNAGVTREAKTDEDKAKQIKNLYLKENADSLRIQTMISNTKKKRSAAAIGLEEAKKAVESAKSEVDASKVQVQKTAASVIDLSQKLSQAIPNSRTRNAQFPLSPSQIVPILGLHQLAHIGNTVATLLRRTAAGLGEVSVLDVQSCLKEEIQAAYEFLLLRPDLFEKYCTSELARQIRNQNHADFLDFKSLDPENDHFSITTDFRNRFLADCESNNTSPAESISLERGTVALAWSIIVESALLDARLNEDLKKATLQKDFPLPTDVPVRFCDPVPTPDAIHAFHEYVRCRWPIHVIAVDPVTQDQNVADSFSRRREMQLALALGFTSGRVGAQSFQRFARRIELDMEAIDLNRTVVGFSHGDDTFGWRFYPRVQTPDIGSNMRVIFYEQLCGGPSRDCDLRQRRLEPGIRECVAVIIMPSFVPYVTFDVRSNWFSLTNPRRKQLDLAESVQIGEQIIALQQNMQQCLLEEEKYPAGTVKSLHRAVEQLSRRLPMQTKNVQMPYENTAGGFELFASGVTDLAPELHGFLGEPGVVIAKAGGGGNKDEEKKAGNGGSVSATATVTNTVSVTTAAAENKKEEGGGDKKPAATGTSIFLVGDHFSVHETVVIAGGRNVTSDSMIISRQILQVNIPTDAVPVLDKSKNPPRKVIDVHVATPYGVSNHLLIPVAPSEDKPDVNAAATAVEEHVRSMHVLQYDWAKESKELHGCLTCNNGAAALTLTPENQTLVIEPGADVPGFSYSQAQLAAWITFNNANGTPIQVTTDQLLRARVGPIQVQPLRDGKWSFDSKNLRAKIQESLPRSVCDIRNISEIVVTGYLRICDKECGAVAPIVKIDSPLTIKLDKCPKTENPPAPMGEASFDLEPVPEPTRSFSHDRFVPPPVEDEAEYEPLPLRIR